MSIVTLGLFLGLIISANYSPGSFLTGWDNLHTEFNPAMNLQRALDSAWQEYQGLGLLGGLSHSADVIRQLFVWALSLLFPLNMVRYVEHWLFLISGVLGIYLLVKYLLKGKLPIISREIGATIAGIYYLLNPATMQTFYLPLETFTVHYAVVPWLFLWAIRYLREQRIKYLLLFALFNIIGATQAYTATLFAVYALGILILIIGHLFTRKLLRQLGVSFLIGMVLIISNLFWLLPFMRFTVTNSEGVTLSRINQFASEAAFLQNQNYGDLDDIIQLKGFWFGSSEITEAGEFKQLMPEWNEHYNLIVIQILSAFIFGMVLLGILLALTTDHKLGLTLAGILIICFVFMSAGNAPFGEVFNFLRDNVSLLREALRFPFTKFSLMLGFVFAISLGISAGYFAYLIDKVKTSAAIRYLVGILPLAFIISILAFPAFQGFFISPAMRVQMPDSYFQLFNYMATQPKQERILTAPLQTHWGWNYHTWGYQGSGFLWYGIEQPIVDRAFDVWSPYNEQLYREFRQAFYNGGVADLQRVLLKYNITWILWDNSKFVPGGFRQEAVLNFPALRNSVLESDNIKLVKLFGDELQLYKFSHPDLHSESVYSVDKAVSAGNQDQWIENDILSTVSYYNSLTAPAKVLAPFREINPIDGKFNFSIDEINKKLTYDLGPNDFDLLVYPTSKQLRYVGQVVGSYLRVSAYLSDTDKFDNQTQDQLLTTINLDIPIGDFYLVINDQVFGKYSAAETVKGKPFAIGQPVNTTTINSISIRVYEDYPSNVINVNPQDLKFRDCRNQNIGKVEQNALANRGTRVYVDSAYACAFYGVYNPLQGRQSLLVNINIDYTAPRGGLSLCFSQQGQCVDQLVRPDQTTDLKNINYASEIGLPDTTSGVLINLDDQAAAEANKVLFADILSLSMAVHRLTESQTRQIPTLDLNKAILQTDKFASNSLSLGMTTVYSNALNNRSFLDQTSACIDNDLIKEENSGGREYVRYQVVNNNKCLDVEIPNVNTTDTYIIAFDVLKNSGRRPEICLLDIKSNTCALYEQVRAISGEWVRNYFVVPAQTKVKGTGYRLTIYNWAVGKDIVDYSYDNLQVYKVNNRDFTNIILSAGRDTIYQAADFSAVNLSSRSYSSYSIDLSQIGPKQQYLILGQAYDSGWLMLTKDTTPADILHAIVGDQQVSRHQSEVYKGWSNIWSLDGIDRNQVIHLVYAPQYLVYVGWIGTLGLVGVLFLSFAIDAGRRRKSVEG
jgi:hypothetical protein